MLKPITERMLMTFVMSDGEREAVDSTNSCVKKMLALSYLSIPFHREGESISKDEITKRVRLRVLLQYEHSNSDQLNSVELQKHQSTFLLSAEPLSFW